MPSKAGADGNTETRGLVLLVDRLASDTHKAKAVEYGNLEAAHLGESRIDMEWAVMIFVNHRSRYQLIDPCKTHL